MTYRIGTKVFQVKEVKGRYFYWSPLSGRWIPLAKSKVEIA